MRGHLQRFFRCYKNNRAAGNLKAVFNIKITIGSDHGAVELKEEVKKILAKFNVEVKAIGTFGVESVDYPDIAEKVCADVVSGESEREIVLPGLK